MRPGRAGGDDGDIRPLDAVHDRQVAGDHVDDVAGHEERRDLARAAIEPGLVGHLDTAQTADSRTDGDACTCGICLGDLEAGVADGLAGRRDAVVDEGIHATCFLVGDVFTGIEVANLAGKPHREIGDIEIRDRPNAAVAGKNIFPGRLDTVTDGRNDAKTGYDHTSFRQCLSPVTGLWGNGAEN